MRTHETIGGLREDLASARAQGRSIGFVPTMGALHAGHVSLLARAREENDVVVASLFVNPTQFTDIEDYEKYPRDMDRDLRLADKAGADMVFSPSMGEVYPEGFDTVVVVRGLSDILEGASRPGHFQGVATVVTKLLNIVGASRAYFGEKDYQQLQVIRRLTLDLDIPTQIVACPIVREADGLAMSSRNVRLSTEQRQAAVTLSRALQYAQDIADTGVHDAFALTGWLARTIEVEPLAKLDYAVIVDRDNLREVDRIDNTPIALVAATFGSVRLIDNRLLHPSQGLERRG